MCVMCDGMNQEDVRQHLYQQICEWGYALVPVGRGWDDTGWAYTLGLVDAYDHPELVVVGLPLGLELTILDELAEGVTRGQRFDTGEVALPLGRVELIGVHELHLRRGLMDAWIDYYSAAGRRDLDLRAVQVVLPDGAHCAEHQTTQPRLDKANHVSFDGTNRATRRAHARRKGR